jgi:hypothetical protein
MPAPESSSYSSRCPRRAETRHRVPLPLGKSPGIYARCCASAGSGGSPGAQSAAMKGSQGWLIDGEDGWQVPEVPGSLDDEIIAKQGGGRVFRCLRCPPPPRLSTPYPAHLVTKAVESHFLLKHGGVPDRVKTAGHTGV